MLDREKLKETLAKLLEEGNEDARILILREVGLEVVDAILDFGEAVQEIRASVRTLASPPQIAGELVEFESPLPEIKDLLVEIRDSLLAVKSEKKHFTPAELAQAFDEWQKRFKETPEMFTAEPTGEACASYLLTLLEEGRGDRERKIATADDEGGNFPPPPGQTSGPG